MAEKAVDGLLRVRLSDARREALIREVRAFFADEFDMELSVFQAGRAIDALLLILGPGIYNQAIQDARGFLQERLEDLDASLYERS